MEGIQQNANSLEMLDDPVQHRGALGNFYNQNFLPVTNSVSFANLKNQKYCSIVATSKFWNFQYGIQLFKIFIVTLESALVLRLIPSKVFLFATGTLKSNLKLN